jgi:hypothetical protein
MLRMDLTERCRDAIVAAMIDVFPAHLPDAGARIGGTLPPLTDIYGDSSLAYVPPYAEVSLPEGRLAESGSKTRNWDFEIWVVIHTQARSEAELSQALRGYTLALMETFAELKGQGYRGMSTALSYVPPFKKSESEFIQPVGIAIGFETIGNL